MKPRTRVSAIAFAAAAFASAAWGHPGHGAEGLYHHLVDLLALGAIGVVFALALKGSRKGGKDHD